MEDFSIVLEMYNGPIELLLSLISKHEIDIFDIPISSLADQYMAEINKFKELNLDITAEFIEMGSYLMLIKSKMLLPMENVLDDEDLEDDDVETVYDTFYGIPKKFVYIGAAAFIVLIIAIFVFSSRKSDDSPKTDTDTTEDESTELFDYNPSGETTDQLFDYVEPTAQTATEQVVDTYDMEDLSTEDIVTVVATDELIKDAWIEKAHEFIGELNSGM